MTEKLKTKAELEVIWERNLTTSKNCHLGSCADIPALKEHIEALELALRQVEYGIEKWRGLGMSPHNAPGLLANLLGAVKAALHPQPKANEEG